MIDLNRIKEYGTRTWTLAERTKELSDAYSSIESMKKFVSRCREDRIYFVNNCIDQVNPQKKLNKEAPFFPCLRQREALLTIEDSVKNDYDVVFPKARKVGASWMEMMSMVHQFLFDKGASMLITSYDDNLIEGVGDGNMNTLFSKFDFMYERLPAFLWVPIYGGEKDNEKPQSQGKSPWKVDNLRSNPVYGNSIWGQAMTEHFGASARGGLAFCDELSRGKFQKDAWVSCGATASSRHAVLTPQGKDFAWGLCFPEEYMLLNGLSSTEHPYVFRIDWRDIDWLNQYIVLDINVDLNRQQWKNAVEFNDWLERNNSHILDVQHGYAPVDIEMYNRVLDCNIPLGMGYDDGKGNIPFYEHRKPLERLSNRAKSIVYPWRIKEGMRYDSVKAAQELDISFDDGKRGRVYAIQFRNVRTDLSISRISKFPLYAGVDPGRGTGNAFYIGFNQWNPYEERYEWIKEFSLEKRSCYFFLPFLTGVEDDWEYALKEMLNKEEEVAYWDVFQEMRDPSWRLNFAFCDPAATSAKVASAHDSIENIWMAKGIPVRLSHAHRDFDTRIRALRRVLGYTAIDRRKCPVLATSISQIEYPKISDNTNSTTVPNGYVHHPLYSHACAAAEYHACGDPNFYDREEEQPEAPQQRVHRIGHNQIQMPNHGGQRREEY